MNVLFSPHNDDETLFAAYTIIREKPKVIVCFASSGDYGEPAVRESESRAACSILGAASFEQWTGNQHTSELELADAFRRYDEDAHPERVWAPGIWATHPEHRSVSIAAKSVFGDRARFYDTYYLDDGCKECRKRGIVGKVCMGNEVKPKPEWVLRKLQALACYRSQILHPRANQFFLEDLREYEGA